MTGTFSNIFEVQSGGTLTKNGTGGFNIIAQVNLLNCTTIVNTGTLTISAPELFSLSPTEVCNQHRK
ncbi:MAG: hypothetical protein IPN49_15420 [Saprospiraceae bacterium]|nr:hypothetical protein [Saprospiraceae bacterium]